MAKNTPAFLEEKKYNQIRTSSIEKISKDSSVQDFLKKFNSSIDEASIKQRRIMRNDLLYQLIEVLSICPG